MKIDSGIFIADLRDVARLARYAEELGYDGLWTAEAGHDPYLPVALAATATERITLGTNIAVAFPRSPLVHAQIAFYASTRTYIGVLEAHGWGETCYRLNEKAAQGDWSGMASLITDEMLEVYAVEGTYDEVPGLLRRKYAGVIDRLGFYMPVRPGSEDDTWRRLIASCRG